MINLLFILIKLFIMLKKPFNKSWGQALKNNQSWPKTSLPIPNWGTLWRANKNKTLHIKVVGGTGRFT
jgi:hypothetical protein